MGKPDTGHPMNRCTDKSQIAALAHNPLFIVVVRALIGAICLMALWFGGRMLDQFDGMSRNMNEMSKSLAVIVTRMEDMGRRVTDNERSVRRLDRGGPHAN